MASLAIIKYQPPAHLKFPKFVFLLLFQFHKKDLLLLFQSFDQEGKDYIFQEQMGDISSRKQSKVLRKSLFGHMAQAYHYFCIFEIWVSFFDIPFCYPLNQPAVASVRRRCCVCLHKIRRMHSVPNAMKSQTWDFLSRYTTKLSYLIIDIDYF